MQNKLTVLVLSVLFLVPTASHAATLEEQKTAILGQLIHLLELQIADLQMQLKVQQMPKLGAVSTTTPEVYICRVHDHC